MSVLITEKEAAEMIGVAVGTLRNSRGKNQGKNNDSQKEPEQKKLLGRTPPPHLKLGYTVRYKRSCVEDWISSLDQYEAL